MYRTANQNKQFHTLVSKLGLSSEEKQAVIKSHSNGRTTSSKELTENEMKWAISTLSNELSKRDFDANKVCDTKRKRIISNFRQIGWVLDTGKPDMKRIYVWAKQQKFKKSLNEHTGDELSVLISISEKIKQQYISAHRSALYPKKV